MGKSATFGSSTLTAAGATVVISRNFHPIVLASLHTGETAAWLAVLFAGTAAAGLYGLIAYWTRRLPEGGLVGLARAAGGQPGLMLTALLVGSVLIYHAGLVMRETGEMAVSGIYPHTPQTFPVVGLIICTLAGAWGGLPAVVRMCRAFFALQVVAMAVLLAGPIAWGNIRYLQPFWGPGPVVLIGRSLLLVAMFTPVTLFLLFAGGSVAAGSRRWWAGCLGIGTATLVLAVTKVVLLKAYPLPLGYSVTFPLHALARLITGGRFFERVEGLWVMLWVFGTALHLSVLLQVSASLYAKAFGMASHRVALLPLMLAASAIAFLPPDQAQTITWHESMWPAALTVGFGLPLVLVFLAAVRGRLGSHAA